MLVFESRVRLLKSLLRALISYFRIDTVTINYEFPLLLYIPPPIIIFLSHDTAYFRIFTINNRFLFLQPVKASITGSHEDINFKIILPDI